MNTSFLQQLWRRRVVVGIALVLSICVGVFMTYRVKPGLPPQFQSREHTVGVAQSRVLIDTHDSIVADLNPQGATSLSTHAQLLADLIASLPIRTAITSNLHIPLDSLAVVPPAENGAAPVPTPVATTQTPPSGASTLTIGVDSTLPLVSISAQAPNQTRAFNLADGTVTALQNYLQSVAREQQIPIQRQPVIKSLGTSSATSIRGPSRVFGAAVTAVLFGVFCYILLVLGGLRQRTRGAVRAPARVETAAELTADPYLESDDELLADAFLAIAGGPAGEEKPPVPIGNGNPDLSDAPRSVKQDSHHSRFRTATRQAQ